MFTRNFILTFLFLSATSIFAQDVREQKFSDKVILSPGTNSPLTIEDPLWADLDQLDKFRSIDPAVYLHIGLNEDVDNAARAQIYTCEVELTATYFSASNSQYQQTFIAKVNHDYITEMGINLVDYAIFKLPGAHKASVQVSRVEFLDNENHVLTVDNPAVFLQLEFKASRYYNLSTTTVLPIVEQLISYNGYEEITANSDGIANGHHEVLISWNPYNQAPAEEYEVEWAWINNYGQGNIELSKSEIAMDERSFSLNCTRVQTTNTRYRIPLVFSKGYLIYRVRPVGRFLDDINKNYYGLWSSGLEEKISVQDWPHVLKINKAHEEGSKNWQYQSSYAEQGKKKEVISYFDGTLRNRQTVTRTNTNKQAIVGEIIYDSQGRAAIEVLPVPLEESAIRYYDGLNKNQSGSVFSHFDFDWDNPSLTDCTPTQLAGMSKTSGASRYYSENATVTGNYQDYVPNAKGFPFSQIEYTPDNTGRIRRKGGVGEKHQIGTGHEMQYFYLHPDGEELNRLFGYNVGYYKRYKKNIIIDPNKQVSISYIDPQGRTIATALAGNSPDSLSGLPDEENSDLHKPDATASYSDLNTEYATGTFGTTKDGTNISAQVMPLKDNTNIFFKYDVVLASDAYEELCGSHTLTYPFVYKWNLSLRDDCGVERFTEEPTSGQIGNFSLTATSSASLSFERELSANSLKLGTYTLGKNLNIDVESLNAYVEDYLSKLRDSDSPCYISPSNFQPDVSVADCNSTCTECEISLVTPYLSATGKSLFENLMHAIPQNENNNQLGNLDQREHLIKLAQQAYIIEHIRSVFNNESFYYNGELLSFENPEGLFDELTVPLYEDRFKREFRGLLEGCRSLCESLNSVQCKVNEHQLLADLSPTGQYGSLQGIVLNGLGNDPIPQIATDPLSIFNSSNSLLYGGYTILGTTEVNGQSITQIASTFSWKNPTTDYLDDFGNPLMIEVEKVGENLYHPAVSVGPFVPTANPQLFLVKPQQLQYVRDFIDYWKPEWAKSLLSYHPEYFYYLYHKAVCEGSYQNVNSDTYDSNLRKAEKFTDVYSPDSTIFSDLLNTDILEDPYFNNIYSTGPQAIEDSYIYNQRRAIIIEALESSFDGIKFGSTDINMLKAAYYTVVYSNGIIPDSQVQPSQFETISSAQLLEYIKNNLPESQQDLIWVMFRNYYLSLKEKIKNVYANVYAARNKRYNGCIEDLENTDSFVTIFYSYNNFQAIHQTITDALIVNYSDPFVISPCSSATAELYATKVKRFLPSDYGYNTGANAGQSLTDGSSTANNSYYMQTGKCPLSLDMENFLDGLLRVQIHPDELRIINLPASSMPFLTSGLYMALANVDTMPAITSNQFINYNFNTGTPEQLKLQVGDTHPIILTIANGETGCGPALTWTGYTAASPTFKILDFKNIYYVPGSYDSQANPPTYKFRIIASVANLGATTGCTMPQEIIIEGVTVVPVGECGYDPETTNGTVLTEQNAIGVGSGCTRRTRFEKAITRLMTKLEEDGNKLFSQTPINLGYAPYQAGTDFPLVDKYGYEGSIMPEILGDNDTVTNTMWHFDGNNGFYISIGSTTLVYIALNQNFTTNPQDIVKFTATNIEENNTISLTYLNSLGQLTTINGSIWKNDDMVEPLDLSCICTDWVDYQHNAEINQLAFINHLFQNRNNYLPTVVYPIPQEMAGVTNYLTLSDPAIRLAANGNGIHNLTGGRNCWLELVVNLDATEKYYENTTHFSNFQIVNVDNYGTATFTIAVHYNTHIIGYDAKNRPIYVEGGIITRTGTIQCIDLSCPTAATAETTFRSLLNSLLLTYRNNGYIPDGYSNSDLVALSPYISTSNGATPTINNFLLSTNGTASQISFSFDQSFSCPVFLTIEEQNLGYIDPLNVSFSALSFNSDYSSFNLTSQWGGATFKAFGSLECFKIEPCLVETKVACESCIPQTVDVVSCFEGWTIFRSTVTNVSGYNLEAHQNETNFCKSNLQYASESYNYYITKFGIHSIHDFPFITIEEFAMSGLGLGNIFTNDAIDHYAQHITAGGNLNWVEFVNEEYLIENDICPPATILPDMDELELGSPNPCEIFVNNVNSTYSSALWEAYLTAQAEKFKQRYLTQALNNITETLVRTSEDKEYQYTLYYYDQAGNLVQTVPPEGVNRLQNANHVDINAARDSGIDNEAVQPKHKMQTQYKYNSLNQLVWQKTPDGGVTKFAYDRLGRIIASQNEKQLTSFYGMPSLTLSPELTQVAGVIRKITPSGPWAGGSSAPLIQGNGYVEYTIIIDELNNQSVNSSVRVGLSYTNSSTPLNIKYCFSTPSNSADQPIHLIKDGLSIGTAGVVANNDVFRIERKGNQIFYLKNGTQVGIPIIESPGEAGQPLIVDIGSSKANSVIRNLTAASFNNGDKFSYTMYDELGRIVEAGEITPFGGTTNTPRYSISDEGRLILNGHPVDGFDDNNARKEVTKTIYDQPVSGISNLFTSHSGNTRNRVTAVLYYDHLTSASTESSYNNGIFYDYDVHGNVKELLQKNNDPELEIGHNTKKVVYDYDLISGNVNCVTYQPASEDQFIHKYQYDDDNRIVKVFTSKDNIIWEEEALYKYYQHGPLARVEIGDKKVQGLDYIYTLQGWLKGVNSERIGSAYDIGRDGLVPNQDGNTVAKDAFGFALNYFNGDYLSRHSLTSPETDKQFLYFSKGANMESNRDLYNGNIKDMVTSLLNENQINISTQFNSYNYDQLNRIGAMTSRAIYYDDLGREGLQRNSYNSSYSYDRNGNLLNLVRNGLKPSNNNPAILDATEMDNFDYKYIFGTNKLTHVREKLYSNHNDKFEHDINIEDSNPYNYGYDQIGQLIRDYGEGLHLEWRVDGKVAKIRKDNGTVITFTYDGLGNRISKKQVTATETKTTYYNRDAQGILFSRAEYLWQ